MHNFHPIADIFPMMPEAELSKLAEDIRANGLREPIWTDQGGRIVDGRNRFLACQSVGVEPAFRPYEGDDAGLPAFVISLNLHRRHLNESQRSMIAAKLATASRGGDRKSDQSRNSDFGCPVTTEAAGEMLNVDRSTVFNAKTVLSEGTPEEIAAVETGEAAVSTTAKEIRKRKAKKEEPAPTNGALPPKAGARVVVPEGKTLESWVREAMQRVECGASPPEAAKKFGLGMATFQMVRDAILLADREDLSTHEGAVAKAALANMNESRQVRCHHEALEPIINRIWGNRGQRDKAEHRRLEDFERGFGTLITACAFAAKMEIPHLPAERRAEAVADLKEAGRQISHLLKRIEE